MQSRERRIKILDLVSQGLISLWLRSWIVEDRLREGYESGPEEDICGVNY